MLGMILELQTDALEQKFKSNLSKIDSLSWITTLKASNYLVFHNEKNYGPEIPFSLTNQ